MMNDQPTADLQSALSKIFADYDGTENELIPLLQDIQTHLGYLPADAMKATATFLNIPESAVYGVATFYAQFYLQPQGRHKIRVCTGTACHVRGSGEIMQAIEKKLGISPGESTEDFEFNLERVACVGSCALAPVVVINNRVFGAMTPEETLAIIDKLVGEKEPAQS